MSARVHEYGRVERMGVEIQESTVLELTEATERATMLDDSAVQEAFESAREDAQECELEDIPEIDQYQDDQRDFATAETDQTAADGGDSNA